MKKISSNTEQEKKGDFLQWISLSPLEDDLIKGFGLAKAIRSVQPHQKEATTLRLSYLLLLIQCSALMPCFTYYIFDFFKKEFSCSLFPDSAQAVISALEQL